MPVTALTLSSPAGAVPDQSLLPGLLMAGGVLLAVVIMLRHWRRTRRNSTELDRDPRERIDEIHDRSMSRDRIETQMAEAEELVRRLGATLDNKAARLEILLEQADHMLDRLEGSGPRATQHPPSGHDAVYRLADEGRAPAEIAAALDRPIGQVELILNLRKSG
ncbi:MAG: hypothetical protein RIB60_08025 [Phycisphaerales bacterium]